jgi:phage-related protein (TIGR01555 family)
MVYLTMGAFPVSATDTHPTRFKKGVSGNPKGRPKRNDSAATYQAMDSLLGPMDRDALFRFTTDGWGNLTTGMGIEGKDKRKGGFWCPDFVTYEMAKNIWRSSALGARMVSTWPNEMLRQGWCVKSDDAEFNAKIEDRAQELLADKTLIRAMEFQRAYGGAAIILGVNDGNDDLTQPLDIERVISLDFLTVLEHREIVPWKYYGDPLAAKYGQPAVYQIGTQSIGLTAEEKAAKPIRYIHETRLITFDGVRVSREQTGENYGWGDSMFVRANQALADFEAGCAAVGILVQDFAPNVFKMKGLLGILAAEGAEAITSFRTRMQALALGKSVANTALVDMEDEYKRETVNVAGLAELWDRLCIALAAIADMPVTLLMGQSPKGLGNEGESDIRFFYDRVAAAQRKELLPQIERLVRIIIKALKLKEPDTWEVWFHPLYQPTEKEQAEARSIQAGTDEKYIMNNVFSADEIRKSRGDGTVLTTHIDDDDDEAEVSSEERAALRDPTAPVDPNVPAPVSVPVDPNAPVDPKAPKPTAGAMSAGAVGKGRTVAGAQAPNGDQVQQTAFNGTQISSAMEIVKAVVNEEIPRESGIALLTIMFPITSAQAATMMGPEGWKPKPPPAPDFGGAGGPPGFGGGKSPFGKPASGEEPEEKTKSAAPPFGGK